MGLELLRPAVVSGRMNDTRNWLSSSWEDSAVPRSSGRPARKYYRLTKDGRRALDEAIERFRALGALRAGEA
jgi:DNA-binding PadR family transcriptional regulator